MQEKYFDATTPFAEDMPIVVSISMLVHNHGKYLRQALDGIVMQKVNFRYQVVVGEDASADNSREILLEYANRFPDRFCLILHNENVGIAENVNSKLPFLKGEFIAPLEGDDFWIDPEKLQKQVDFLRSHPNCTAVSHRIKSVNQDGNIISSDYLNGLYCLENEFTVDDLMKYHMPGQNASMLFKNYLLDFTPKQMQTYMQSPVMGDRKVALICVLTGRVWCMPDVMSAYRKHDSSWNSVERAGGSACYHYFESFEMEKLAFELFGISIDYSELRMHAWFGTVVFWVRKPSYKNLKAVMKVWTFGGKRIKKLVFLIRCLLKSARNLLKHRFSL